MKDDFDKGVIVFSTNDCGECDNLKEQLTVKGVSFKEYDLFANANALNFISSKGLRSVPQLFKDGVKVEVVDL